MAFDFEAIIIGSGFGATVVATELVNKPQFQAAGGKPKVLMLERGVWWFSPERPFPAGFVNDVDTSYPPGKPGKHPVQYWPRPDHRRGALELLYSTWANVPGGDRRNDPGSHPQPLYRYFTFDELDVVTASGVGGGSLVYSNVSIEPHLDGATYPVMNGWPLQLTPADYVTATGWMTQYRGATANVVTKFPPNGALPVMDIKKDNEYAYLGKVRWLKEASDALKAKGTWPGTADPWAPLNLAIIEYPDGTANVASRTFCERQGRCFLGCLPGARHTLNKTIIKSLAYPADPSHTVGMRALCEVTDIKKLNGGGYEIHYEDLRFGDNDAGRHNVVTSRVVVLSTGCLPSNEMMLRLQNAGWKVSDTVGKKFSTNGDYAGFIDYTRTGDKINFNPSPFPIFATRGPINASHVKFRDGNVFINFEDATLPPMLAPYVRTALDVITKAADRDPFFKMLSGMWNLQLQDIKEDPDVRQPGNFMTEAEVLQNTFFFNMMGSDESRGVFSLDKKKKLTLNFTGGLSNDLIYKRIEEVINGMVAAMNEAAAAKYPGSAAGTYFRFPFWGKGALLNNEFTPDRKFITVHPLGGCNMGTDSSNGVVNTSGQVYDTTNPGDLNAVHQDFYIADASVIPGPLAVNPTLTIVAFAKKIGAGIN